MRRQAALLFFGPMLGVFISAAPCLGGAEPSSEGRVGRLVQRFRDSLDRVLVPRCLTPEAARVMSELVARGALRPVLGQEFTLERGDVRGSEIELEIRDGAGQSSSIVLTLAGSSGGRADGQGRLFRFYLQSTASSRAAQALLEVAALFDQAIPDTALERCAGGGEHRYPRVLILASALAQWLVIAAAVIYGLAALRSKDAAVRRAR